MPRAALAALWCLAAAPAAGQQLTATEASAGALATLSARPFWGAAAALGRRLDNQTRVVGAGAAGMLGGNGAVRLEGQVQLIVNPSGRGGAGLYAGAGLAWQGALGVRGGGYVTALLGLESAPGARRGWYAEVGLGGGVRLAVGARWRRFPPWWR